jgi:mRNA-degrading endonuclease toxin of MazEF toxin-antitoxin module
VNPHPHRGQLYWVAIPAEPRQKKRPALVISAEPRNRLAGDVLVIPASTALRPSPTHVRLKKGQGGVRKDSVLKCEQITTLPKKLLSDQALGGPLSGRLMDEVERGVIRSIGIPVD